MTSMNLNKTLSLGVLSLLFITVMSCGDKRFFTKTNDDKLIDKRLVGVWKGAESGNIIEGMSSEWVMTRHLNGSFSLDYKATLDDELFEGTEIGTWWIENGLFHEFHEDSGKTDTYHYEILNKTQIKFKAEKIAIAVVNEHYEFIDTKISD